MDVVQSRAALTTTETTMLAELWRLAGLDASDALVVDPTSRVAGTNINQTISKDVGTDTVTVTRSNSDPLPGA